MAWQTILFHSYHISRHLSGSNKNKIKNSSALKSLEPSKIKGNNISMTAKFFTTNLMMLFPILNAKFRNESNMSYGMH